MLLLFRVVNGNVFVFRGARVGACIFRFNEAPRDCAPVNRFGRNSFLTHTLRPFFVGNSAHSVDELETCPCQGLRNLGRGSFTYLPLETGIP
jgi:hypothetical protein